jgi:hypothetical protein
MQYTNKVDPLLQNFTPSFLPSLFLPYPEFHLPDRRAAGHLPPRRPRSPRREARTPEDASRRSKDRQRGGGELAREDGAADPARRGRGSARAPPPGAGADDQPRRVPAKGASTGLLPSRAQAPCSARSGGELVSLSCPPPPGQVQAWATVSSFWSATELAPPPGAGAGHGEHLHRERR